MTPDPKDSLNGYQLVGPSEDGKINNLLAELKARESAQRFQALIDEWLIGILPTNVEQVCNSDPGAALLDQVTILASGEAIVFGSGFHVPTRVQFDPPMPGPHSQTVAPFFEGATKRNPSRLRT